MTGLERARHRFEVRTRRERRRLRAALRAARQTYTAEGGRIDDEERRVRERKQHNAPAEVLRRARTEEASARDGLLRGVRETHEGERAPAVAHVSTAAVVLALGLAVAGPFTLAASYDGPRPLEGWAGALALLVCALTVVPFLAAVQWAKYAHGERRAQRGRITRLHWLREEYDRRFRELAEVEEAQGIRGVCEVVAGPAPSRTAPLSKLVNASDDLLAVPFPDRITFEATMLEAGDPRTVVRYNLARDVPCSPSQVDVPGSVSAHEPPAVVATVSGPLPRSWPVPPDRLG